MELKMKIIKLFVMREYWKEYFKGLYGNHRGVLKRETEINECYNHQCLGKERMKKLMLWADQNG